MAAAAQVLWYGLYNVVLHVGALVSLPFWLGARVLRGRYKGQFLERMGVLDPGLVARFRGRPAVWVHAASAGESAAAAPLVRRLKERLPDHAFLFTITSRYGKEMAEKRLAGVADGICFSPLDLPLFCRRFLNRFGARLYVMVETDFWPNLVRMARRRGARVALASGHAGPRSFPRSFWRAAFRHVDLFCMQTERDADNIRRRGAPPERVFVGGNLKFDGSGEPLGRADAAAWRRELGLPGDGAVLVAGSTLAEDEGPVLDAVRALRDEGLDLRAVVAPRRQERVEAVVEACRARGLAVARRSRGGAGDVLVLDTMGELARTYNVATAAYVGGGFTPDVGLHNLLEPLVCGVPVLFGPHRGKAARVAGEILRRGAGLEVADAAALLGHLRRTLGDAAARDRLASAGGALMEAHRGAAERQAARILELVA